MTDSNNTDRAGQTLTLHSYGDKELWIAQAADSSWSLPMFVEWKHDKAHDKHYAIINPAVSLYTNQSLMMQALLQVHDIMGEKTRWLVPRAICEAILHKAPGITPAFYYRWPDEAQPALPPAWNMVKGWKYPQFKDEEMAMASQPFLKYIASKSGVPVNLVSVVFKAICQEAPRWMLENKASLDLGFCQLVALPFRANWKEIVTFKCRRWKLRGLFSKSKSGDDHKKLHDELDHLGMQEMLCSPHNIAMKQGRMDYTLEAIPTKQFNSLVHLMESEQLSCGFASYVAHYEESVEKYYHLMVRALGNYVRKVAAPFAKVSGRGVPGGIRFVQIGGKQVKVRGIPLSDLPAYITPPDSGFASIGEESDPGLVQAQADALPEVSHVPQATPDLRERTEGGDVVKPGTIRTNGLLLRHVKESYYTRKPVLHKPSPYDRDDSGVD